jgi:hypothetical protein
MISNEEINISIYVIKEYFSNKIKAVIATAFFIFLDNINYFILVKYPFLKEDVYVYDI